VKYRKKPVVIEAVQWTGHNEAELTAFYPGAFYSLESDAAWNAGIAPPVFSVKITTLEGVMTASPGDYIIKGVSGEFYPCKPDIFEKTYELVE
jgi:hypothetical protein